MDAIHTHFEVQQFLFLEAALLDEHRYEDWLNLFAEDATYWVPIRSTRLPGDEDQEFTSANDAAYFSEDRKLLEARIVKLRTGFAWAEDPRSRTRHCITNVRVLERTGDEVVAESCFITHRDRLDDEEDWWVGRRLDRLRFTPEGPKFVRREVYLDQTVIKSKNLSTFL